MKIAYISTSLPTTCGIATFNDNLFKAINQEGSYVIALDQNDSLEATNYPNNVKFVIRKNKREDYSTAANYINNSDAEACILEHEFGIYGGESGLLVLSLMAEIKKPITAIFHTVLKQPTYTQQTIIQQIAKRATKIVVMSKKAIGFLTSIYDVPNSKIEYIEHGVPDLEPTSINPIKSSALFSGKKALLTFGLISRNKGLETVVNALPEIVKKYPETVYFILGNTHPGVIKDDGEEYRESLIALSHKLNVSKHLVFINEFVEEDKLHQYLCAADVYITPYLNEAQITSGTLAYAIGAGAAVVSTPYWHAQELLAKNRGLLFDFKDYKQLANTVINLFDESNELETLKSNAYQYGLSLRWPVIGQRYLSTLSATIINRNSKLTYQQSTFIDVDTMPKFDLSYVRRLTNDTGIVQHAKYGIPNLKEGYCLDDNSRALIMALMAHDLYKTKDALDLMPIYLSYIQYMQTEDGNFRNFLSFNRNYLDEIGSEDSFGRTIWALGCLIKYAPNNSYREFGQELFLKSVPHFKQLKHLRGIANTLLGLYLFLKTHPNHSYIKNEFKELAKPLINAYQFNCSSKWKWFEEKMTYDNAILPLALLCYYEITEDTLSYRIAMESLDFLTEKTMSEGYLNPVGNKGWLLKGQDMSVFDQQAIETMAMAMVYFKCYETTKERKYLYFLRQSYLWFLGENSLKLPLYDPETKGCADGLQPNGVNRNQGAESTLAYLISHLMVFKALQVECDLQTDKEEDLTEQILEN
jgi:glycosyltransferase involved in cell wall biosynthesis